MSTMIDTDARINDAAPIKPPGQLMMYRDREHWLSARPSRIGASEVAILFGIAPKAWGSPYSLWLEKTGKLPREDSAVVPDHLRIGLLMEPVSKQLYEERSGNRLWKGGSPYCVALHPRLDKFGCTPDGWVTELAEGVARPPGPGLWQTKNAAWFVGHDWDEGVPEHVVVQEQAEMAITGAQWSDVAVIIGGSAFRFATVIRNNDMIAQIEEQVEWFNDLVKRDEPPPIDGSEATHQALLRLHPKDDGSEVVLPPDSQWWWNDLQTAKERMKIEKELAEEAKNKIQAAIGASTFGVLPDGKVISYKHTTTEPHMVQGSTYRTLREASKKDLAARGRQAKR